MSGPQPVSSDDLHAFVDGQLPPAERDEVARRLETDAEAAQLVAAYQVQRQALRAAFAARASEPVPSRLALARILEERHRRRPAPWRMAAAVLLALGVGGAAGWALHWQPKQSRVQYAMSLLEQQALTSHIVYAPDNHHAVEVSAGDVAHLSSWLSGRLKRHVSPPDLSGLGYHLIGGRLLATEHGGAAALLMYGDDAGDRLSVLMRPMSPDLHAPQADVSQGQLNSCAWIESGLGYAVVAALPDHTIDRIVDQIRAGART